MTDIKFLDGEFTDKAGRAISFRYLRDASKPNRGFVDDILEAWNGDEKVGYIRCEYMTKEAFARHLPTVWNYINHFTGRTILPWNESSADPRSAPPEIIGKIVDSVIAYRMAFNRPGTEMRTYRQFQEWVKQEVPQRRMAAYQKEYRALRKRIDFPFVSYVCTKANPHQGIMNDNTGLGIGTELYRRMAIELAERGLQLRSSALQSDDAAAIWQKLNELGWTVKEGDRMKLMPDRMEQSTSLSM